jgi:aryl-alcohol dehydrogenase-like predicted oxidoreductase
METRELGRSGIAVSRVILGCGGFGGVGSAPEFFGKGESEAEALAIMDAAWDLGIRAFDTADAYGGGRSETYLGNWLRAEGPAVRDEIVITTKTFNPMGPGGDRGLARHRVLRQVETSLERLGLERIPLYMAHDWDPDTPLEETLLVFDELVTSGKIGAVGASNVTGEQLAEALEISELEAITRFEWVQNSYSLLDREPENGLLSVCREHGVGFAPYGALAGGWLTGKYRREGALPAGSRMTTRPEGYLHLQSEHVFRGLEALAGEAAERGVSTAGLALAWTMSHPDVRAVVVGPRRPEHLEPVREALALELDERTREHLGALFE